MLAAPPCPPPPPPPHPDHANPPAPPPGADPDATPPPATGRRVQGAGAGRACLRRSSDRSSSASSNGADEPAEPPQRLRACLGRVAPGAERARRWAASRCPSIRENFSRSSSGRWSSRFSRSTTRTSLDDDDDDDMPATPPPAPARCISQWPKRPAVDVKRPAVDVKRPPVDAAARRTSKASSKRRNLGEILTRCLRGRRQP